VKTCLCSVACKTGDWTVEGIVDVAAQLGFDGIELWGNFLAEADEARLKQIRDYCDAKGLAVPLISPYMGFFDLNRSNHDEMVAECEKFLRIAQRMGVPAVRSFAGFVCEISAATADEATWAYAINGFAEYAALGEKYGIDIAIETHDQSLVDSMDGIEKLFKAVPSRRLKINFQIDKLPEMSGMSLTEIWQRLRDRVVHMHYHASKDPAKQEQTKEIFRCMKQDGWDGFISIEYCEGQNTADGIARVGLQSLRELWDAA